MNIVQIIRAGNRSVAVVDGDRLRLLRVGTPGSVYELAMKAMAGKVGLEQLVKEWLGEETVDYDSVYEGGSEWQLLPSFDHPFDNARCMVSGTGLTHKASAENRSAMHKREGAEITDSIRMYQMGLEGGIPADGEIGVQPEWFYKGDGSLLRGHGQDLEIPAFGWDGGEEPEIAGAYVISETGVAYRVGLTAGNEFSDHKMEKQNYLYLAPSKLRNCAIGPELVIGNIAFDETPGAVGIVRDGKKFWGSRIWSGEKNMSYSVRNLEHHHFKYPAHRRPGDCHVHFFGADAFSFGEAVVLKEGDVMEVEFEGFGRALKNRLRVAPKPEELVRVSVL